MVRRVTLSQFKSIVRQQQQKTQQAIDKYNRQVRAHNQKVNQAINSYNQQVQTHNARVRSNQQRLRSEIARLNSRTATTSYSTIRVSAKTVYSAYSRLEDASESGILDDRYNELIDLSEREAANSASVLNALLGEPESMGTSAANAIESALTPRLASISAELSERWRGALFALNPQNPDAARHFCTSTREIITNILNMKAPDAAVAAALPNCQLTPTNKTPSRRAKLQYLLHLAGTSGQELEDFVESDLDNIVDLFQAFNEGAHGPAGTFNHQQLGAIRTRVEDGISFLLRVIS